MKSILWEVAVFGLVFGGVAACGGGADDTAETDAPAEEVPEEETDCDDGDDEDADGATDCEDDDCENNDDCTWIPTSIAAGGSFAYDATGDKLVKAKAGGQEYAPSVAIYISNQRYQDTGDEADSCAIVLTYTGTTDLTLEALTGDEAHAGFKMPAGQFSVEHNCPDNMDVEMLGTPEQIAAMGWGVGVGELATDVADQLEQSPELAEIALGGGFFWGAEGVPDPYLSKGYAVGIELDAEFNLQDALGNDLAEGADPKYIQPPVDGSTGVLPTGYYEVYPAYVWSFQQ